jgi:dihydropteroate synthase
VQNTGFSTNKTLNLNGRLTILDKPMVMGILNVTPDSFYDGGKYSNTDQILKQTERMLGEGADLIDVGGYSSRPGATDIPAEEEKMSVLNAIRSILKHFPDTLISVDTFRSPVAKLAVNEGAAMINDISAGELDPMMFAVVSDLKVPYVAMHMRGTPQTMSKLTHYTDLIGELIDYLQQKIARLHTLGVKDIIIDPGFGFAKTREQNFQILNHLDELQILGRPILAGLSRKSMIWKTLEQRPEDALNGTTALNAIAVLKSASILRVHDVKEAVEVVKLLEQLKANT